MNLREKNLKAQATVTETIIELEKIRTTETQPKIEEIQSSVQQLGKEVESMTNETITIHESASNKIIKLRAEINEQKRRISWLNFHVDNFESKEEYIKRMLKLAFDEKNIDIKNEIIAETIGTIQK